VGNAGCSAAFTAKEKEFTVYAGVLKRQMAEPETIGADIVVALDDEQAVRSLEPLDAFADTVGRKTVELLLEKVKPGGGDGKFSISVGEKFPLSSANRRMQTQNKDVVAKFFS
jgi:hypothetical protein